MTTKPGQGQEVSDPVSLTDEQVKQVEGIVNGAVNGAITNHLSRFKKDMTESVTSLLGQQLAPIGEQLKTLASAPAPTPGAGKKGSADDLPDSIREQMARQTTQIDEQKKQIDQLLAANKAEKDAREAELNNRLKGEERNAIAAHLRTKGWNDASIRAATAILHTEDQRVSRSEDGSIVFRQQKGTGAAAYVDQLPVEKGLDLWLTSDEGKSLTPARQVAGSGAGSARGTGHPAGPSDEKAKAAAVLKNVLMGVQDGRLT